MSDESREQRLIRRSLLTRKRRRLPRFVPMFLVLGLVTGIVALWVWVFAPIFIEPEEWHGRQKRFDRLIREVLRRPTASSGSEGTMLPTWPPPLTDTQVRILACAEAQVARGVRFSAAYHPLDYPWGDMPEHLATSPDLVVRCLRRAGLDLQQMVHIDKKVNEDLRYPLHLWASRRPDRSIDHRRMPNLFTFARKFFHQIPTAQVETPTDAARFIPGDIVFWAHGGTQGFPGMCGIVIDRRADDGVPWVVTVVPRERRISLHHKVTDWPIMAHFRVESDVVLERFLEAHPKAELQPRPPDVP